MGWKEKHGYNPDDTLKKNPKAVGFFLALVIFPLLIGILAYIKTGG